MGLSEVRQEQERPGGFFWGPTLGEWRRVNSRVVTCTWVLDGLGDAVGTQARLCTQGMCAQSTLEVTTAQVNRGAHGQWSATHSSKMQGWTGVRVLGSVVPSVAPVALG